MYGFTFYQNHIILFINYLCNTLSVLYILPPNFDGQTYFIYFLKLIQPLALDTLVKGLVRG